MPAREARGDGPKPAICLAGYGERGDPHAKRISSECACEVVARELGDREMKARTG